MRRLGSFGVALMASALMAGCDQSADEASASADSSVDASADLEAELTAARAAAERFQDVEVALAEGYIQDPMGMCETAEMMGRPASDGAMGIHYFRPDLLQITAVEPRVNGMGTHTDFSQPGVLLYEPQEDGSMELVGVENVVFRDAWHEAGHTEPPSFAGVPFDYMENDPATELDEAHMFEPHYDLHVWLFRDNPNGMFAQFNPSVTCEHHAGEEHAH